MMKRAFTLIELMIVIAVMTILMGLVVRLNSSGSDSTSRLKTVTGMQRLENCLSGYYAAFGNYPAVKLHGTRDIYAALDQDGDQTDQRNENLWNWNKIGEQAEAIAWEQVQSACKAQPVDCCFPFPDGYNERIKHTREEMHDYIKRPDVAKDLSQDRLRQLGSNFDDGVTENIGRHRPNKDKVEWSEIKLFKFGVMSFLLPRYLVMMNGNEVFFREYAQWTGNNVDLSDPFTGNKFSSWADVRDCARSSMQSELARVANIPSQAVCARWLPNLRNMCTTYHDFSLFGVDLKSPDAQEYLRGKNTSIEIYEPKGQRTLTYLLDKITVNDGWGREFYYYSPSPYQRYTLWSGGKNGRSFPPWIDRAKLSSKANECIGKWTYDDILHMSN